MAVSKYFCRVEASIHLLIARTYEIKLYLVFYHIHNTLWLWYPSYWQKLRVAKLQLLTTAYWSGGIPDTALWHTEIYIFNAILGGVLRECYTKENSLFTFAGDQFCQDSLVYM